LRGDFALYRPITDDWDARCIKPEIFAALRALKPRRVDDFGGGQC
jgi:hypothetical protein